MPKARPLRRFTAWIAACAIVFGGLAPALTHALQSAAGGEGRQAEVCTATGVVLIALDEGGAAGKHRGGLAGHVGHCPYCGAHALGFALPGGGAPALGAAVGADPLPDLGRSTPPAARAWVAAQPRAPPRARS